jgi:hypothetical protein
MALRCAVVLITTPSRAPSLAADAAVTVAVGSGLAVKLDDVVSVTSVLDFKEKWVEFAGSM